MYAGFVLWALLLVVCEFVIKLFVTKNICKFMNETNFRFANPEYLYALAGIVVFVGACMVSIYSC